MDVHRGVKFGLLAAGLVVSLSACGDPQKSAQEAIQKVSATLQQEKDDLDPQKQLAAYDQMVTDVQAVAKKYADTKTGKAIAAGQSVDGVSLADITRKRDTLAARAKCYADPTAECLRPFSRRPNNPVATAKATPGSVTAQAATLVCTEGFAAADKSLDAIKINKPAYMRELGQIAFAASKCGKPDDVRAAIGAYLTVLPAQGDARVNPLLSVLATKAFSPAWPAVTAELEKGLKPGGFSPNAAASVTLNLAVDYARMGNARAALDKYAYFTDTLHYRANPTTQGQLAAEIIADGEVDAGLKIAGNTGNQNIVAAMLHTAAGVLGNRMGLVDAGPSASPALSGVKDIRDYMSPVAATAKAQYQAGAGAIEARLDAMTPVVKASPQTVGGIGLDADYGILALIHQKLGAPDKAKAAMKKGADHRVRLLGRVDANPDFPSFAAPGALVAMAQGDFVASANYVRTARLSSDSYGHLLLKAVGRTQNAEQALAIANAIGGQRDLWHCYNDMIPEMAQAGRMDDVDKLIAAWAGNPAQKASFQWLIVQGLIARGDADGARKYADANHLANDTRGKLRLDSQLLAAPKIASDRSKAEPIIREMFQIGQDLDKAGGVKYVGGTDRMIAQNAATAAFKNGYTDLGIELYQAATNKDQRPLVAAFTRKISRQDTTRVLMLAQNTLSGEQLGRVIDSSIQALQTPKGSGRAAT